MEKIKVPKQVIETKQVTVYRAFDGKEFEKEKDCLKYERKIFNKQEFEKQFNISKINDYEIIDCILSGLEYSLDDFTGSMYKVTILNDFWDVEFDTGKFINDFKLYFEINDDEFVIPNNGELIFVKHYDYIDEIYSYHFISKEDLIQEFNKRIETIRNL